MDEDNINELENQEINNSTNNTQPHNTLKVNRSNGVPNTDRSMQRAGTVLQGGGKALQLGGRGGQALGNGLTKAGNALNSTGHGAFLGVPMSALGKATSTLGKATEKAGEKANEKGKELTGKGNNENNQGKKSKNATSQHIDAKIKKTAKSFFFKNKWTIILIGVAIIIIFIFMFFIMVLDLTGQLDDEKKEKRKVSYSNITTNVNGSGNEQMWWPIGSSEITTTVDVDDTLIEFASGTPITTSIKSYYDEEINGSIHGAIDITNSGDIPIIAMADGTVSSIICGENCTGYNNPPTDGLYCTNPNDGLVGIIINYENGYTAKMLHLASQSIPSYLEEGSKVYQGQIIGKMGNTGCSTEQRLHLEVSANGEKVDPLTVTSSDNPRPIAEGVKKSEDILSEYKTELDNANNTGDETVVVGGSNQEIICKTFKNYGYPDSGVAALMVNMSYESGFNPKAVNSIGCIGLVQWCFGRANNLKSIYGKEGWKLINNQLERVNVELNSGSYNKANNALKGTDSVAQKTFDFCMTYEIPGRSHCLNRKNDTKKVMDSITKFVTNGCQ